MDLQKCELGHFFDGDEYELCPICGGSPILPKQDIPPIEDEKLHVWEPFDEWETKSSWETQSGDATVNVMTEGVTEDAADGLTETLSFQAKESEEQVEEAALQPVAGWLVCVEGKNCGKAYELHEGQNSIGRGEGLQIDLKGEDSVSREGHANVVYDSKNNCFYAIPVVSSSVYYIDGNKIVLSPEKLVKNSILTIRGVKLMLIPCCDEVFRWTIVQRKIEQDTPT